MREEIAREANEIIQGAYERLEVLISPLDEEVKIDILSELVFMASNIIKVIKSE